jgi:hypothetical protein
MMPSDIPFLFLSFESSHYGQILRYQLQTQKPVLITRTGKVSLDLFHELDKDTFDGDYDDGSAVYTIYQEHSGIIV